jgi:hypothetical protein
MSGRRRLPTAPRVDLGVTTAVGLRGHDDNTRRRGLILRSFWGTCITRSIHASVYRLRQAGLALHLLAGYGLAFGGGEGCIGRSRILLYVSFVLGGKKGRIIMTTRWNDTI